MHITLGLINDKNYLNHLSTFNFKFSIKNYTKLKKPKGKNQTQVQNQECICKQMSIPYGKIHRWIQYKIKNHKKNI